MPNDPNLADIVPTRDDLSSVSHTTLMDIADDRSFVMHQLTAAALIRRNLIEEVPGTNIVQLTDLGKLYAERANGKL